MTRDLKSQLVSGELLNAFGELLLGDRLLSRRSWGYGGALSPCVYVKGVRKFVLDLSTDSQNHGRLLIASTDGIGEDAQQGIDRQEK